MTQFKVLAQQVPLASHEDSLANGANSAVTLATKLTLSVLQETHSFHHITAEQIQFVFCVFCLFFGT